MQKKGPKLYKLTKTGHEIIFLIILKIFLSQIKKEEGAEISTNINSQEKHGADPIDRHCSCWPWMTPPWNKFEIVFTSLHLGTGATSWQSLLGKIHLFNNRKKKWSLWLPNSSVGLPLRLIKVQCPQNRKGIEIFRQIKHDKVSDTKPA